jgi:5-dehydro-4-deoxyglucarate dehydratase
VRFDGVLFFPVTPFDESGEVASAVLREHLETRLAYSPGGIFAACGTGEFSSLDAAEVAIVTRVAVEVVHGQIPVVAGAGGSVRHATACALAAEDAGADGVLLLPPYLVAGPQSGLVAYVEQVAEATHLPIVVYHRANAQFLPETFARLAADSRIVGFKDGVGDLALTHRVVLAARATGRADLAFFNGLLTAELSQPAYRAIGVPLYSSAVFAMAPAIADAFYRAYVSRDDASCADLLARFYAPFVEIRDRAPGYAVSLIKAGVALSGLQVGSVRAPLADPAPSDIADLKRLLELGVDLPDR